MRQTVEAGGSLLAVTAASKRDVLRREIDSLQREFDEFYSRVSDDIRQVSLQLVEWSSCAETMKQVEEWIDKMAASIGNDWVAGGSLDEKKTQLQTYRV